MTTFIVSSRATLGLMVGPSDSMVLREARCRWRQQDRAARQRKHDCASVLVQAPATRSLLSSWTRTTTRSSRRRQHGMKYPSMSTSSLSSSSSSSSEEEEEETSSNVPSDTDTTGTSNSSNNVASTSDDDNETNKTLLNRNGMDSEIPMYHSTLMTAMRDYFGDDGREIQEYTRRPLKDGSSTQPLFRLLIMGGDKDSLLARRLYESTLTRALYYMDPIEGYIDEGLYVVVEEDVDMEELTRYCDTIKFVKRSQVNDDKINKWAQQAQLEHLLLDDNNNRVTLDSIVRFAKWACVDAVFVGCNVHEQTAKMVINDVEQTLANSGITLFQYDVGTAIANKQLDVLECLSSLVNDDDMNTTEALIE